MASASNSPVTLPSINEMFPEHMMHGLYDGRRDTLNNTSASVVKRESTPDYPRPSATPRPGRLGADIVYPIAALPQEFLPQLDASQPSQHYRNQRAPTQDPHRSYSAISRRPTRDARPQSSQSYSLDLLRPNAVTSTLDTIATSHNVAYQPRPASSVYSSGGDSLPHDESAESFKSRPSFRVDLPPGDLRDSSASHVLRGHSFRDTDHMQRYHDSARYADHSHLASSATGYPGQSVRTSQPHVPPGSPYEEKKHCCPHCNKRFNRPSSLNIHVNTHTGAKPFICPYPGCQRRFNVNSNMRRHYRNHVSNGRRRDAVARLIDPTPQNMPPTPPLSASPTDTPVSHFSGSLPSSASSDTSTPLPSRSPSPVPSYYPESDEDTDWFPNGNQYAPSSAGAELPRYGRSSYFDSPEQGQAGPGPSRTTRRQRSRSSPVPPSTHGHAHMSGVPMRSVRPRSSSCNVPGCDCQPAPVVSTTLRPAFMMASARSVDPPN